MRDVIERLVEQAEFRGAIGNRDQIADWFKGAVFGLYVKSDRPIQFGESELMFVIFHLLEQEGLIMRNPDFKGKIVLGQPAYILSEAGKYLAEGVYQEYVDAQPKH